MSERFCLIHSNPSHTKTLINRNPLSIIVDAANRLMHSRCVSPLQEPHLLATVELQPEARFVLVSGAGHNVHQENPQAVLNAMGSLDIA